MRVQPVPVTVARYPREASGLRDALRSSRGARPMNNAGASAQPAPLPFSPFYWKSETGIPLFMLPRFWNVIVLMFSLIDRTPPSANR